jgi:hypothetical protein
MHAHYAEFFRAENPLHDQGLAQKTGGAHQRRSRRKLNLNEEPPLTAAAFQAL